MIFSPLSILNVLAILLLAANGDTYKQMKRSLYLKDNKIFIANQFHKYSELLENDNEKATLSIANQIYVRDGYMLNKTFQNVAAEKFSCCVQSLNFGNNIQSAQILNNFVENKTHCKIKNFIKSENIKGDSKIMLINAIYFKSNWKNRFNKTLTFPDDFYVNENETIQVDFMKIQSNFHLSYMRELDASALEMKYANSKYSCYLGMVDMFDENEADFSRILETNEQLYVSDVIHKASIEINEYGSEAAATGILTTYLYIYLILQSFKFIFDFF